MVSAAALMSHICFCFTVGLLFLPGFVLPSEFVFYGLLNPNRTGLFDMFRFGEGRMPPPPSLPSLFVDLWQRNFVQGLTIKALAQICKKIA